MRNFLFRLHVSTYSGIRIALKSDLPWTGCCGLVLSEILVSKIHDLTIIS